MKQSLSESMRKRKALIESGKGTENADRKTSRKRAAKVVKSEVETVSNDTLTNDVLQNQLIEASGLLQGYSVVVGKLVSAVDALSDKNDFLKWIKSVDEKDYPAQAAMIRRIQNWKRESFLVDSFELMQLFLKQKSL